MEFPLLQTIDFKTARALQIGVVFFTTLIIQWAMNFQHAAWIGFAVMMIYAGFDTGTSLHRTSHRFLGTSLGLILSWFLWALGVLNYRLLYLIIPVIVFLSFASLGKRYAIPTIFTVTLTALGTDYFAPSDYQVRNFFFDYFRSTYIAFTICIVFESIIFRKKNLTHLFYLESQQHIIHNLEQLLAVLQKKILRERDFLRLSVACNIKILEFEQFLSTSVYDYHVKQSRFTDLEEFNKIVQETYFLLRYIFVHHDTIDKDRESAVSHHIQQLKALVGRESVD